MMNKRCLILGAGHAGVNCAARLRKQGWDGEVVIFTEEKYLPYHRPFLSKELMIGTKQEHQILLKPEAFYSENAIDLRLGTYITHLDLEQQKVLCSEGSWHEFDCLVFATGSVANRLQVSDAQADTMVLRSLQDAKNIKQRLDNDIDHLLLIGGGYIGLEIAAAAKSIATKNIQVTVVEAFELLARVACEQTANRLRVIHEQHGVQFVTNTLISNVVAKGGKIHASSNGNSNDNKSFVADLVVEGIGVRANSALVNDTEIATDRGILTDEKCMTNVKNIYAIGDCAQIMYQRYGEQLVLESVPAALESANVCADNICGIDASVSQIPWFWSDQYKYKLQIAGLNKDYDDVRVFTNDDSFVAVYSKAGCDISVDCLNLPKGFMIARRKLAAGENLTIKDFF